MLDELLQNARRSGASEVTVTRNGPELTLLDNGTGIAVAADLLTFGKSRWRESVRASEDPAGMGVYSLSRTHCRIRSRHAGEDGWQVELGPEHFTGEKAATVLQDNTLRKPGTEITLTLPEHVEMPAHALRDHLQHSARYCPVKVTLKGEALDQHDFLANATLVTRWHGIRIGVAKNSQRHQLNFHGITIAMQDMPRIASIKHMWSANLDVVDAPELELTLPARHGIVRNAFVETLYAQVERVIYETLRSQRPPAPLPYENWKTANELGLDYPPAPIELENWKAMPADRANNHKYGKAPKVVTKRDDHIVVALQDTSMMAVFEQAARKSGLINRLVSAASQLAGYAEYDAIPVIDAIEYEAEYDNDPKTVVRWNPQMDARPGPDERPSKLRIIALVKRETTIVEEIRLSTDFVFDGTPDEVMIDDVEVIVTKEHDTTATEVRDLLMLGYFEPADDCGTDSYETQERAARELAQTAAIAAVEGDDAAYMEEIHASAAGLASKARPSDEVSILITNNQYEIKVRPGATSDTGGAQNARAGEAHAERVLKQERVLLGLTEKLAEAMNAEGVTHVDVAKRSGVAEQRVLRELQDAGDMTTRELVRVAAALGLEPRLEPTTHGTGRDSEPEQ